MSYDLILLPCPADLGGARAVAWFEEYEEGDGEDELSPRAIVAWDLVVGEAATVLPGGEMQVSSEHAELTWADDGLTIEFWPDEATISLSYWHDGAAAAALLGSAYRLARTIASHTGLRAFDPQLDRLVDESHPDLAAHEYARVRATLSEDRTP